MAHRGAEQSELIYFIAWHASQIGIGLSRIRLSRRKVIELRRYAGTLHGPEACDDILAMAAQLETSVNAIEAELDEILSTGRID